MPRKRNMTELQNVVSRLRLGHFIRVIHRETGIHRNIIRAIKKIAIEVDWLNPNQPIPQEEAIQSELKKRETIKKHPLENYVDDIERWIASDMSYTVIHRLINERYPCGETTVRRFIHKRFPEHQTPIMIREHTPGEKADVDFGYLGLCYDPESKRNRKAWLFSLRLRYSRKTFRTVVLDQREATFFKCHIDAFEYFGGVPAQVVLDNLKAGVIKASREEPIVNHAYRHLAEHYGFIISPCLPYTPRHKGGVENDVKYVKKNFLPYFLEKQREKGIEIPSLNAMRESLDEWSYSISDARKVGGVGKTPQELFEEEKSSLKSLPANRWTSIEWRSTIVGRDWRVRFDKSWYSVPYSLIGKKVNILATQENIRIFYEGKEVALHLRSFKTNDYVRVTSHAPVEQEEVLNCTRGGLLIKAERIGKPVLDVVEAILSDRTLDKLLPVRRLLRLEKKYGAKKLSKACERALFYEVPSYGSVKSILKNGLEGEVLKKPPEHILEPIVRFKFARDPQYFKEGEFYG